MTDNNPSCIIDRLHQLEAGIRDAIKALGPVEDPDALKCLCILVRALAGPPNAEITGPENDHAT